MHLFFILNFGIFCINSCEYNNVVKITTCSDNSSDISSAALDFTEILIFKLNSTHVPEWIYFMHRLKEVHVDTRIIPCMDIPYVPGVTMEIIACNNNASLVGY